MNTTPTVKPLRWETYFGRDDLWRVEDSPACRYYTIRLHSLDDKQVYSLLDHADSHVTVFGTLAGAKAAAQRSWKRHILRSLVS